MKQIIKRKEQIMLIRSQDKKSLYNLTTNKGLWIRHKNKGVAVIAEGLGELGNYTNENKAIKVLDQICSEYLISRLLTQTENLAPRICGVYQMPQDEEV